MKDLCLLVADSNMSQALDAALVRHESFGIHPITFDIRVHPGRDGGMRTSGANVLSLLKRQFSHGLLILDFEGCGTNLDTALDLESEINNQLFSNWKDNAKAIVIEPEFDIWMWGSDNALREIIGWPLGSSLRDWLRDNNFQFLPNDKPARPKEALERILIELKQPRSSALYRMIASRISLPRCTDSAFIRLRETLTSWFPISI
jgi:hypothetical protein